MQTTKKVAVELFMTFYWAKSRSKLELYYVVPIFQWMLLGTSYKCTAIFNGIIRLSGTRLNSAASAVCVGSFVATFAKLPWPLVRFFMCHLCNTSVGY